MAEPAPTSIPFSTSRAYAGIGARSTPPEVLALMRALGGGLARAGWTLRSGGAKGADQAFEAGARAGGGACEIYTPWPGFEGQRAPRLARPTPAALELAARHHPALASLSSGARALHARNSHQVLGAELDDPALFVVCFTADGSLDGRSRSSGGTGQALRIAATCGVRVINLARASHLVRAEAFAGL